MSVKDIDTFTQHFIQKCVQVIVQSRLGSERTQIQSNPNGKDWFNLGINDYADVHEQTFKCLKNIGLPASSSTTLSSSSGNSIQQPQQSSLSQSSTNIVKKQWKVCCEILLRNSDGISLALEYWVFSNFACSPGADGDDGKLSHQVSQIFNRMSNMLKSLIVLTRATPAYKLSFRGQSADSYVICYRVFKCDDDFLNNFTDSTASIGSSGAHQSHHFSSVKHLGTIQCSCNELTVSFIYRNNMNIACDSASEIVNMAMLRNSVSTRTINDLLLLPVKEDHFKKEEVDYKFDVTDIFKPLNPAFASDKVSSVIGKLFASFCESFC